MDHGHIQTLRRENARLRGMIRRRAVIEQAKGALTLRFGLDDDAAFAVLRRLSQNSNVRLHTVAETLISAVCRGDVPPPGGEGLSDGLRDLLKAPVRDIPRV